MPVIVPPFALLPQFDTDKDGVVEPTELAEHAARELQGAGHVPTKAKMLRHVLRHATLVEHSGHF